MGIQVHKQKHHRPTNHLLLDPPAGTNNLPSASLSFLKTTNLDSSTTLPSNPVDPDKAIATLFLRPNPPPLPQSTIHSPTRALAGTTHPAQIFECLPTLAPR